MAHPLLQLPPRHLRHTSMKSSSSHYRESVYLNVEQLHPVRYQCFEAQQHCVALAWFLVHLKGQYMERGKHGDRKHYLGLPLDEFVEQLLKMVVIQYRLQCHQFR